MGFDASLRTRDLLPIHYHGILPCFGRSIFPIYCSRFDKVNVTRLDVILTGSHFRSILITPAPIFFLILPGHLENAAKAVLGHAETQKHVENHSFLNRRYHDFRRMSFPDVFRAISKPQFRLVSVCVAVSAAAAFGIYEGGAEYSGVFHFLRGVLLAGIHTGSCLFVAAIR
jgi:hypothetical protein